jgi:hypothetical protein
VLSLPVSKPQISSLLVISGFDTCMICQANHVLVQVYAASLLLNQRALLFHYSHLVKNDCHILLVTVAII